jgi:hypothetical protein
MRYNKVPPWSSNLRTFGVIGITPDGALGKIESKLTNRALPAMFIGHPPNHSNDVFQFMVLSRRSIITSRSGVWLNKTYGDYMKVSESDRYLFIDPIPEDSTSDLDDDVDLGMEILRGERDQQVYFCTRCGRSGHVAAHCYQLRSATNDSDSDDDEPPPTPVRRQPPVIPPAIPLDPLPVTDDDISAAAHSLTTTDDTNPSDDTVASFIPRVSGVGRVNHTLTKFYNPDPSIHAE